MPRARVTLIGTTVALPQPEPVTFSHRDRIEALIKTHRSLFVAGVILIFGLSMATGYSIWYMYAAFQGLPDETAVRAAGSMDRATTIVDVKGRHAFTIFKEQRLHVSLSDVSPNLISAMIAIEDQRFYDHGGI